MKKILISLIAIVLIAHATAYAQHSKRNATNAGYYWEYLPPGYNDAINATKKYPLIIFLHGKGQIAACTTSCDNLGELDKVLQEGIPEKIHDGATMCFTVDGQEHCFIVISPQLKNGNGNTAWNGSIVEKYINAVLKNPNYRIDKSRVYLTGLSLGAIGTYDYAKSTRRFSDSLAAIAPIAGKASSLTDVCLLSTRKIPVWAFHGSLDTQVSFTADKNLITALRNCVPAPNPSPRFTIYVGETHTSNGGIWSWVYNTDNTIVDDVLDDGTYPQENLYEWFLKYRRVASNVSPTANAGADQNIQLPTNAVTLNGSANDVDGTITSYQWTKISGGVAVLSGANTATLTATDLQAGTYLFRLEATDNQGAIGHDEVQVVVLPENVPPVVNAGSDQNIQLPTNAVTLNGSASDADGTIGSYQWTQISGGAAVLSGMTTATLSAADLEAGTYVFRLEVTDHQGAIGFDEVQVIVRPANISPVANAGADVNMQLPQNTVVLSGTGSDADGSVTTYQWTKLSGGAATLSGETTATLSVSELEEGSYIFRLTVTDNDGAEATDDVVVTVTAAPEANWLEMSATNSAGKSIAIYFNSLKSNAQQQQVRAGGNNYLRLYLKLISGVPNWSALKVELTVSYQTRSLAIGTYATSIGSSWTEVQIPLDDFMHDPVRWTSGGLSLVNFKTASGFGTVVFGVDEISFVGGTTPFTWYGDTYATSGTTDCVVENSTIFIISNRYTTGGVDTSTGRLAQHHHEEAVREIQKGDIVYMYNQFGALIQKEIIRTDDDATALFGHNTPSGFYILKIVAPTGRSKVMKVFKQ